MRVFALGKTKAKVSREVTPVVPRSSPPYRIPFLPSACVFHIIFYSPWSRHGTRFLKLRKINWFSRVLHLLYASNVLFFDVFHHGKCFCDIEIRDSSLGVEIPLHFSPHRPLEVALRTWFQAWRADTSLHFLKLVYCLLLILSLIRKMFALN